MAILDWAGKSKIIGHHRDVKYRTLERIYNFDENGQHTESINSENMIIHGDNLEALKSLLPKYQGKIRCVYIDPPYNTGNENWVYNDNVNHPMIKKWIGEVVGKEGEDLSRHDKWLCMMYPRLKLIEKLLTMDGRLIISISYHEVHNLVEICKEIFSAHQVVTVTVQTSGGKPSAGFNYQHEYLVFVVPKDFSANELEFCGGKVRTPYEGLTLSTFTKVTRANQVYPIFIEEETGKFVGTGRSLQELIDAGIYTGEKEDFVYDYSIAPEGTVAVWPVTTKGKDCVWRQISSRLKKDWETGYIKIAPNKNKSSKNKFSVQYLPKGVIDKIKNGQLEIIGHEEGVPTLILGHNETVGGQIPTLWTEKEFFTVNGTALLESLFPEVAKAFDYPKPVELIKNIIMAVTDENDIILDSFAGSGTTAHAVLDLNKREGNRKFIIIEMEDYADNITAERVKRVINGYTKKKDGEEVEGTGGSFSYYELGQTIFNEDGLINEDITVEQLREYVYYSETKGAILAEEDQKDNQYYLGINGNIAYYFYFERGRITTLNYEFLATIRKTAEAYIIYADKCVIDNENLIQNNITFKKIPRDVVRF